MRPPNGTSSQSVYLIDRCPKVPPADHPENPTSPLGEFRLVVGQVGSQRAMSSPLTTPDKLKRERGSCPSSHCRVASRAGRARLGAKRVPKFDVDAAVFTLRCQEGGVKA